MRSVLAAIRRIAAASPDRVAVSDAEGRQSYGELAEAIARLSAAMTDLPPVVGLLLPRGRYYLAVDLAVAALGRTIVPLPDFFSAEQWRHMVADAGIGAIVTTAEGRDRAVGLGVPVVVARPSVTGRLVVAEPSRRVIYTSGTTGRPKGVVLTETAMQASLDGLAAAAQATAADVHLSLLPFSLLLEQLAGILLPLSVGARVHVAASPAEAEAVGATTSVVVPDLLAGWVRLLDATGRNAPSSLRFVAVGGAPVGEALAEAAWRHGLPVHEGYGLSECCSVVAVNRPGHRRSGTAGRPLQGVTLTIDDGEIVVRGPTVMSGYLGGTPVDGLWRTGDLGRLDADGNLVVLGRKDDVVVTPQGRNVHPEWIEPMLRADPAIRQCAVIAGSKGVCAAILPADGAAALTTQDWLARVQAATAAAPAYARPAEVVVLTAAYAHTHALFTVDGRPRRRRIAQLKEVPVRFYDALLAATQAERDQFMSIPLIAGAVANGVQRELYLSFLHSAYHHVRYTVPLLQAALKACGPDDVVLAAGLEEYVREEIGHDEWILDDIAALGGDADATRHARPPLPVRVMVAHAFHLIAEEGPLALLGMVHVLEGMSVALAVRAAQAIKASLGGTDQGGFSYLTSHGGLDIGHVDGFARLLDAIDTPVNRATVVAAAKDFYTLYGNVFRALVPTVQEADHAA